MSGDGEEYTDEDINDVYDAISDAWEEHTSGGGGGGGGAAPGGGGGAAPAGGGGAAPAGGGGGGLGAITVTGNGSATGQITVTAKIEWAGELLNNGRGGERTVRLAGVDTRPIVAALKKARALEIRALRGPLRSYTAKSPQAQLHQLGTKNGQEALKAAGFNPSPRTLRRWEQGTQKPSRANREKIAEAYENVRNPGRGIMGARREVVNALTESVKALPGESVVRFRDIREMRIR